MNNRFFSQLAQKQEGSILVVALMVMAVLSIMGVYAVSISHTEQQITTNIHTQKQAFYNADAGVRFTIASLKKDLGDGNAVLPPDTSSPVFYSFPAPPPAGFSFGAGTRIRMIGSGPDTYEFAITGTAKNAFSKIESKIMARFIRPKSKSIDYAAFGDELVDIKNSGSVQSYDSESGDAAHNDPGTAGFVSTHEAHIGSNGKVTTKSGSHIDGDADLGENPDGETGINNIHKKSDIYGIRGDVVGRIDPDPLGIDAGGDFDPTSYQSGNDNDSHMTHVDSKGAPQPIDTSISTKSGGKITLKGKPGGSNFYFTDVELKSGVVLEIDTSGGPVNIFIDGGGFDAGNCSITNTSGNAADFAIYANSESTDDKAAIKFSHDSEFRGIVYAPKADITMNNSGSVYGLLWGRRVDIKNSGDFYYDEAFRDKYSMTPESLKLISWEQI